MIAPVKTKTTKPKTKVAKYTTEEINDRFLEMLPTIQQQARRAFSGYDADRRQEAIQAVAVIAFEMTKNLAAAGRLHDAYPSAISRFAIGRYRQGRTGTSVSTTDVTSPFCQQLGRARIKHYGLAHNIADSFESESLARDARYPVHRLAQFRLDFFEGFYQRQSSKDQEIIRLLAYGESTGDVAKKYNVAPAMVTYWRRKYEKSWREYIADPREQGDFIAELQELARPGVNGRKNSPRRRSVRRDPPSSSVVAA